jgi:hypothetical protein
MKATRPQLVHCRYIYLVNLLDHDETLFYRTIMSDPARFLPIVYDPTIGEACLNFGHIFRGPRGMYLSIKRRGHVKEVLRNWPVEDVRFICVWTYHVGGLAHSGVPIPRSSMVTKSQPATYLSSKNSFIQSRKPRSPPSW